jgi:hypothetical protein
MSAEVIAKALGGRKVGTSWSARCPAHDDSTPSLSLSYSTDGKLLVRCHAGCDQDGVNSQDFSVFGHSPWISLILLR